MPVTKMQLRQLADMAWAVRDHAYTIGPTKVGCAVICADGSMFAGCNVEHRYRCHDVHAEVNAITNMVAASGGSPIVGIFIAAERSRFTPCGGCMDWIMQFAVDSSCVIISQSVPNGEVLTITAREMMPYYPE